MGTALTAEQVGTLGQLAQTRRRWCSTATAPASARPRRRSRCSSTRDVDGRIARMPAGRRSRRLRPPRRGPAAFRRLVEGARPMLDQFIQDAASEATIPGRVATLETVAELLVRVKQPDHARALRRGSSPACCGLTPAPGHARAARGGRDTSGRPTPDAAARWPPPPAPVAPARAAARKSWRCWCCWPVPGAAAHGRRRPRGRAAGPPGAPPAPPAPPPSRSTSRASSTSRPGSTRRPPTQAATRSPAR